MVHLPPWERILVSDMSRCANDKVRVSPKDNSPSLHANMIAGNTSCFGWGRI